MIRRIMLAVLAMSFTCLSADQEDYDHDQSPEEQFSAVEDFVADDIAKEKEPECTGPKCDSE